MLTLWDPCDAKLSKFSPDMYKRHDASSKWSVYLLRTKIFTEQKTFSGHPRIYHLEFMSHQHQKELELNIKYMTFKGREEKHLWGHTRHKGGEA